jgi:hypothetical protein
MVLNCNVSKINRFVSDSDLSKFIDRLRYECTVLWDLTNSKLDDYCIAWRKGVRKIWSLPYDASRLNISLISDSLPIFDEICRRTINFVYSCLNSDSEMIRSVVLNGVNGARFSSPIGRNTVFCALRYKIPLHNIGVTKFNSNVFFERLKSEVPIDQLDLAKVLREAILIRDGVVSLYDSRFQLPEIKLSNEQTGLSHDIQKSLRNKKKSFVFLYAKFTCCPIIFP